MGARALVRVQKIFERKVPGMWADGYKDWRAVSDFFRFEISKGSFNISI